MVCAESQCEGLGLTEAGLATPSTKESWHRQRPATIGQGMQAFGSKPQARFTLGLPRRVALMITGTGLTCLQVVGHLGIKYTGAAHGPHHLTYWNICVWTNYCFRIAVRGIRKATFVFCRTDRNTSAVSPRNKMDFRCGSGAIVGKKKIRHLPRVYGIGISGIEIVLDLMNVREQILRELKSLGAD